MSRNLTTVNRSKLDDQERRSPSSPHHVLKDGRHSGGNILIAVVNCDRRADDGLPQSIMHTVSKDLHSPSTLARIGTLQAACLGPARPLFGFDTAYEYMRKTATTPGA